VTALLFWKDQAREDLLDIYVTIALDNIDAAERLYKEIGEQIALLRDLPRMGVRRSEITPFARMLIHGVYLIFYKTRPDTDEGPIDEVEIVRIVHGHRDLSHLF